jgi:protein-export membrane protein SecD
MLALAGCNDRDQHTQKTGSSSTDLIRLTLEINRPETGPDDPDLLDRTYAAIKNRINQLDVPISAIQKEKPDRIIVKLPVDQRNAINFIVKDTPLEFNLVRDDTTRERALSIIEATVNSKEEIMDAEQDLAGRLFGGGGADTPAEAVVIFRSLIKYMSNTTVVETKDIKQVNDILRRDDVREALDSAGLGDNIFLWSHESFTPEKKSPASYKTLYYLKASPEMKGGIKDATATYWRERENSIGFRKPMINTTVAIVIEMNAAGARRFATVTDHNINRHLAFVLDSTVYSAPHITSKIIGGRLKITGGFTMKEAQTLATILRTEPLPAPVSIIEERIISP